MCPKSRFFCQSACHTTYKYGKLRRVACGARLWRADMNVSGRLTRVVRHIASWGEFVVQGFFLDRRWSWALALGALAVAMTGCGAPSAAPVSTQATNAR